MPITEYITGEAVTAWREHAAFTSKEAASFIGVSPMQLWRMENGKSAVGPRVARIILQWYAIDALMTKIKELRNAGQ